VLRSLSTLGDSRVWRQKQFDLAGATTRRSDLAITCHFERVPSQLTCESIMAVMPALKPRVRMDLSRRLFGASLFVQQDCTRLLQRLAHYGLWTCSICPASCTRRRSTST
jgi:hypothetical protein